MDHQYPLTRRRLLGTAAALAGGAALVHAQDSQGQSVPPTGASTDLSRPRTVILVRHGEKAADDPRDPNLSEAGKLRAVALNRLLGETRVTHVWTSEFRRTKDFASGVAQKNQLVPEALPGKDLLVLAARLKTLAEGSISLVVGHSNTLPAIAKALGASLTNLVGGTDLRDDEYDRFVVITLGHANEAPALLELRYGA